MLFYNFARLIFHVNLMQVFYVWMNVTVLLSVMIFLENRFLISVSMVIRTVESNYSYSSTGLPSLYLFTCTGTIIKHKIIAEFTAQTLSLSYLNGDFGRWCCGYKIRLSGRQSGDAFSDHVLTRSLNRLIFSYFFPDTFNCLTKETAKYENESCLTGNLIRIKISCLIVERKKKDGRMYRAPQPIWTHLSINTQGLIKPEPHYLCVLTRFGYASFSTISV